MLRKVTRDQLIASFKSFVIEPNELAKYIKCENNIISSNTNITDADDKKQIIAHTSDGQAGIREHTGSIAEVAE